MIAAVRRAVLAVAASAPLVAGAQTIHAATETSPYTRLQDGKVVGTGVDLVEAVLRRAGMPDHRVELYPWARAYEMALTSPNVLLFLIAHTPQRQARFKWVGDVLTLQHQVYKLRTRTDIQLHSTGELPRYSIGIKREDVLQQFFPAATYPKVVVSGSDTDIFRKLIAGQIDLMPMPAAATAALCQATHFDCHALEAVLPLEAAAVPMGLAYSLQTPDATVERTRAALEALRAEGSLPALVPFVP